MLILTRRVGETLVIGDEIRLTVLGTRGNQVRIGVNAPKDVAIVYRRPKRDVYLMYAPKTQSGRKARSQHNASISDPSQHGLLRRLCA